MLPWEDVDEYHVLASSLADEHRPQGPAEEHLVEELAGILWRKRRLRLAERPPPISTVLRTPPNPIEARSRRRWCIWTTASS